MKVVIGGLKNMFFIAQTLTVLEYLKLEYNEIEKDKPYVSMFVNNLKTYEFNFY